MQRYGTLPDAGGLLDQDDTLMNLMDLCYSAYVIGTTNMMKWTAPQRRFVVWLRGGDYGNT